MLARVETLASCEGDLDECTSVYAMAVFGGMRCCAARFTFLKTYRQIPEHTNADLHPYSSSSAHNEVIHIGEETPNRACFAFARARKKDI